MLGSDMQGSTGGTLAVPDVTDLGFESWAEMTGMAPAHPLVGGTPGAAGYGGGQRQVAVAQPDSTAAATSGHPAASSWKQLANLKGNPVSWVMLALVGYLAITHVHVRAGAAVRYGKGK